MIENIKITECAFENCPDILDLWSVAGSAKSITDRLSILENLTQTYGDLFLVAKIGAKIVGSVIGGWDGWRAHVYRLAVLPEFRRRKIAEHLMRELERRLISKGALRIFSLVESYKPEAVNFWTSSSANEYQHVENVGLYVKNVTDNSIS